MQFTDNFESVYIRKRQFPGHSLTKGLNVSRNVMVNRLCLNPKNRIKLLIDFSCLRFSKAIDSDTILIEPEITETPNNVIKEMMTVLFNKFDKKLQINKSDESIFLLRFGDKVDYMLGEEGLYCYEEVILASQLRKTVKLRLCEMGRYEVSDLAMPHAFNFTLTKSYQSMKLKLRLLQQKVRNRLRKAPGRIGSSR